MKKEQQSRPVKGGLSQSASGGTTNSKRTEPGYKQLLTAMTNVRRTEANWPFWLFRCVCSPVQHKGWLEYKPSRYTDEGNTLLFTCRLGTKLDDLCNQLGLDRQTVIHTNGDLDAQVGVKRPGFTAPLPPPCEQHRRQELLFNDRKAMAYLCRDRGLNRRTVREFGIGWDGLYYLPVRDQDGSLVGERRYNRFAPDGDEKMKGLAGRTARLLYPDFPKATWILLCEGEWDALLARRHGFPSLTTTGGVNCWDLDWNRLFRGLRVAIAYDCDEAGRNESVRRAGQLAGSASVVKVVDLGLADKEDLTDWFVKHRRTAKQLRALIRDSAAFDA